MPRPSRSLQTEIDACLPVPPRDYLILFALVDGARHGHGLLKAIEAQSDSVLVDPANLYRSLRKLERDGLVVEVDDSRSDVRETRRRCFALTSFGRAVLEAEAARLTALADAARARRLVRPARASR